MTIQDSSEQVIAVLLNMCQEITGTHEKYISIGSEFWFPRGVWQIFDEPTRKTTTFVNQEAF